jgi:hypothetical protein
LEFIPGASPFPATTLHIVCPKNLWNFDIGEPRETSDMPNIQVEPDEVFGPGSEFGFEKTLRFFRY